MHFAKLLDMDLDCPWTMSSVPPSCPSSSCSSYSPMNLIAARPTVPETIWLDIFGYLTLREKVTVASTCRTWNRILADPSLYTHIELDHMEFNTLVGCMQQLCKLAPRIKSLRISHCYSHFISKTTVPVQHTSISHHFPAQPGMHSLYSHITSFTPPRRREEYRKLGFTLHQEFSKALVQMMEQSQSTIKHLEIQDNFLDLEMTELIFSIVRYGRHLESLLYDGNNDGGFVAPEVVSAITAACPKIQGFRGKHAISDTVLRRMITGWEDLKSITLAPYKAATVNGVKEVTMEGVWSLLECGKIETLELLDLDCINNDNIMIMLERIKQIKHQQCLYSMSSNGHHSGSSLTSLSARAHPMAHHAQYASLATAALTKASQESRLAGESVKHLKLTKYTSTPLTLPGFGALLKIFPNLESFELQTNYFTFDHQFQGLTMNVYEEEIAMVERMVRTEMSERWGPARGQSDSCWMADWDAPITEDQRLRVGIMNRSG